MQLNLQAFHLGIQNIPPFFWEYLFLGLLASHKGQWNTHLPTPFGSNWSK